MGITIREVAKAAGVSIATVSKVINQSPSISEGTASKVQQVMKELQYYPNQRAQNLARRRSNNIALLSPLSTCNLTACVELVKTITGILTILEQKSYTLSIHSVTEETGSELVDQLSRQKKIDGVIVMGSMLTYNMEQVILTNQIPYIILGKPRIQTQLVYLYRDSMEMGKLAAEYMKEKSYKRIAICGQSGKHGQWDQIIMGLRKNLRVNQILLKSEYTSQNESTKEMGYHIMERILYYNYKPDIVLCENFDVVKGVCQALQQESLIPGEDVDLLTFGEVEVSKAFDYKVNCIYFDYETMGNYVASSIIAHIKRPDHELKFTHIEPKIYKCQDSKD